MTPLFGVIVNAGTLDAESVDDTPNLAHALRLVEQWSRLGCTDVALYLSTGTFSTCILRTVGRTWLVQPSGPIANRTPGASQPGQRGGAQSSRESLHRAL